MLTNKLDLRQNFLKPLRELVDSISMRKDADDDDNDNDDDVVHGGDFSLAALFDWNMQKIEGAIRDWENLC